MSFEWDKVFDVVSGGLGTYERLQLAEMGYTPVASAPNDGVSGSTTATLPDQTAVGVAQTVGPVPPPDSGVISFAGLRMDKGTLQMTGLVLLLLWGLGKLRVG